MNEENKTFAEQVVEPTESERIRERITNYKAQISPQSVKIAQLLLEQHLKAGLVKTSELDAIIMLRDDLNKASIDYRTMMESNQKRLQQLAEEEQVELLEKQQQLKMAEEKFKEIMGGMMPFMTAPPEVNNGDECLSVKK